MLEAKIKRKTKRRSKVPYLVYGDAAYLRWAWENGYENLIIFLLECETVKFIIFYSTIWTNTAA